MAASSTSRQATAGIVSARGIGKNRMAIRMPQAMNRVPAMDSTVLSTRMPAHALLERDAGLDQVGAHGIAAQVGRGQHGVHGVADDLDAHEKKERGALEQAVLDDVPGGGLQDHPAHLHQQDHGEPGAEMGDIVHDRPPAHAIDEVEENRHPRPGEQPAPQLCPGNRRLARRRWPDLPRIPLMDRSLFASF